MAGSVQEGLRILRISEICRINLFIVVHNHNANLTHAKAANHLSKYKKAK